jgi:3-deoxy-manno-octulosonate cytidylyltransferase (CMP-KDO synthetase)
VNVLVIPARWGSTRFPGKPLALIKGVPMVVRVWGRVKEAKGFDRVGVAADDERVWDICKRHEVDVVMTSDRARNGTERSCEVANILRMADKDLVVNVQGDEPLMDVGIPQRLLFNLGMRPELVWTAVRKIREGEDGKKDVVKCQVRGGYIDWFTRRKVKWGRHVHVGVYGYSVERLRQYVKRGPKEDELKLGLEQLRWRESLACFTVDYEGVGVDRPHDIEKVEKLLAQGVDDGKVAVAKSL